MRYVVLIIVIAVLSVVLFQTCEDKQAQYHKFKNTTAYLNDSVRFYKNKYGQEVATKTALQGDNEQLGLLLSKTKKELTDLTKKYKRVKTAVEVKTVFTIDTLFVPFSDPIDFTFKRPFVEEKVHYRIKGMVTEQGITFNDINIPSTLSLVIGERKNGLFKPRTIAIDANVDNPLINIEGLESYIYKPKIKRWGVGVQFGYDVISLQPSLSVGINYNFIRF